MKSIARLTVLLTFFVLAVSCERSAPSTSKVRISMSGSIAGNLVPSGIATDVYQPEEETGGPAVNNGCTICIKSYVINVDASDFSTIVFSDRLINATEPGIDLTVSADIIIPTGSDRTFQMMAMVYDVKEDKLKIEYGIAKVNLANAEEKVIISMDWLKGDDGDTEYKPASIVGRYLTGSGSGPTGVVKTFFKYSNPPIRLMMREQEINNGWFSFDASENFPITYKVEGTGELVFGGPQTTESLNPATAVRNITYVKRPKYHNQDIDGKSTQVRSWGHVLYGFFEAPTAAVGIAGASYTWIQETGGSTIPFRDITSDVGAALTFSDSDSSASIFGVGYGNTFSVGGSTFPLFDSSYIRITASQFDGLGLKAARGLEGAFSFWTDGSDPDSIHRYKAYQVPGTDLMTVYLKTLPGLFYSNTRYSGFRAFVKQRPDLHNSTFSCSAVWLANHGFAETSINSVSASGNSVNMTLAAVASTDTLIICPKLGATGLTEEIGGIYLNNMIIQ